MYPRHAILIGSGLLADHIYTALALATALEGLGLPIPAELLFIPAGLMAHTGTVSLRGVILVATGGALAGNLLGYALGRWGGRPFLLHYGRAFRLTEARLARVDEWFARYGGRAVMMGRFVGVIRAATILVAGASRMSVLDFAAYQLIAGLLWNGLWATAAWRVGHRVLHLMERFGTGATLLTLAAGAAALAYLWLRRRRPVEK